MNMLNDLAYLLGDFWRYLQQPDALWQIGVLLVCLAVALVADRLVRRRTISPQQVWRLGQGGLQRLAFPLLALLLVLVARALLKHHLNVQLLSLAIPLLGSLAAIRAVFYVLRHSFGNSGWLASFERFFALSVWSMVALYITGLLPELIDMLEGASFAVGKETLNLWQVAQGIVVLLATLLIALWINGLVEARLARATGLDQNLRVVFTRLAKAGLLLFAVLIGLPLVGIDLTTLSVFGGALGVGIGFGLQKIASSYVSGFIILLDRSIRIGNFISVGSERGQVTQITTRYTVLKGLTGVEAIVPNEILVSSVVLNESYTDPHVRVALPVQIGYASDIERAMRIMIDALRDQPRVLSEPEPMAFVVAFADSGINLELGFWINDPQLGTLKLRSDIYLTIWRDFQKAGIEIPYPQREVRVVGGNLGESTQ
ncbi:MAG: mechanosensitive ion channel [Betaproteobacteria bacterium]|nr:mechanosensitive ion channel [Betaproteobacteria bacterium]